MPYTDAEIWKYYEKYYSTHHTNHGLCFRIFVYVLVIELSLRLASRIEGPGGSGRSARSDAFSRDRPGMRGDLLFLGKEDPRG